VRGRQTPLVYEVRRWATVLSLGPYAVCSFITGEVADITAITDFGHAWTWVALTGWLLALFGLLRHARTVLRDQG
jgi:hypothetical protein